MALLDGRLTVISGGTSGIGAEAARLFTAEESWVVVGGRREAEGNDLAAELGPRARFVPADVMVESDVEGLVAHAVAEFGRLDVMINNAGVGGGSPGGLDSIDLEHFWTVLRVHVGGVLVGMKYAARVMLEQGSGSIINTASIGGQLGGWTGTGYSAAKAAVIQLTRSAAIELGEHGIRVNSVSPGPIPTGIFGKAAGMDPADADRTAEQLAPTFLDALGSHQPLRRAGTASDVAQAMLWLASDASSFVNGQDIVVDGGITAGRPASVPAAERRKLAAALAALT
jgi:NAD(P)-dependent dehydrogenase (short-subunit alcohol dehydrogenase family)